MTAGELIAPLLLLALLAWAGGAVSAVVTPGEPRGFRLVLNVLAGCCLLHLLLTLLDRLRFPWSPATIVLPLLATGALRFLGAAPAAAGDRGAEALHRRLEWSDVVAAAAVLTFAALAATLWIASADFLLHWGMKGARFFAAGGIDYGFLEQPWNAIIHPGYPPLLPELYAATALLASGFAAPAQMLWSVAFLSLLLLALRRSMVVAGLPEGPRQALLAAAALSLAAIGIGDRMAGSPDWMIALALAAAAPAFLAPATPVGDWQVGISAAFAAISKMEGYPLALLLVAAHLFRRRAEIRRPGVWIATALPPVVVGVPWLLAVAQHQLGQPFHASSPSLERAEVALTAAARVAATPAWHGMPAILLLLPALVAVRRTRLLAAVVSAQLACYLWIYVASPMETEFFVWSSFARLCLHLVPTTLVLSGVAIYGPGAPAAPAPER